MPGMTCQQQAQTQAGEWVPVGVGASTPPRGGPTLFFRCRRCRPGKRWQMSVKSVPNWLSACRGASGVGGLAG